MTCLQNLDSPDHVSHTAFLSDLDNGDCPSTHPVPLMKLLYEVCNHLLRKSLVMTEILL